MNLPVAGGVVQVGVGIIDAHAGSLGMLATQPARGLAPNLDCQLGLISGTSACHMILNKNKMEIPGVWGPYFSAVLPGKWLHEGGQSSVGSLIDHIIQSHPAYANVDTSKISIYEQLEKICEKERDKKGLKSIAELTKDLHVWPDFHGNRCPVADPDLKGAVVGLTLDKSIQSLAFLYLATLQSVAYGTKHIVDHLTK